MDRLLESTTTQGSSGKEGCLVNCLRSRVTNEEGEIHCFVPCDLGAELNCPGKSQAESIQYLRKIRVRTVETCEEAAP